MGTDNSKPGHGGHYFTKSVGIVRRQRVNLTYATATPKYIKKGKKDVFVGRSGPFISHGLNDCALEVEIHTDPMTFETDTVTTLRLYREGSEDTSSAEVVFLPPDTDAMIAAFDKTDIKALMSIVSHPDFIDCVEVAASSRTEEDLVERFKFGCEEWREDYIDHAASKFERDNNLPTEPRAEND